MMLAIISYSMFGNYLVFLIGWLNNWSTVLLGKFYVGNKGALDDRDKSKIEPFFGEWITKTLLNDPKHKHIMQ